MNTIAFIGGGNMASALIGGLHRTGLANDIIVVDPGEAPRRSLVERFGVRALASADASLAEAQWVVWAVKPQQFQAAAATLAALAPQAMHFSVMAGIRCADMAHALNVSPERVIRSMPNTPALIGQGVAGLYAAPGASAEARAMVEQVMKPTGQLVWVKAESDLDTITAISGSGPAYVFLWIEAMMEGAMQMGLSHEQARTLVLSTFAGATELASRSQETPATLRERVTSKGGTTHAALTVMDAAGVKASIQAAMLAAKERARTLGDEFGR